MPSGRTILLRTGTQKWKICFKGTRWFSTYSLMVSKLEADISIMLCGYVESLHYVLYPKHVKRNIKDKYQVSFQVHHYDTKRGSNLDPHLCRLSKLFNHLDHGTKKLLLKELKKLLEDYKLKAWPLYSVREFSLKTMPSGSLNLSCSFCTDIYPAIAGHRQLISKGFR